MDSALRKLPNEPITVYTAPSDGGLQNTPAATKRLNDLLDLQTEPVIHIVDLSALHIDMQGLIALAGFLTKGDVATFAHPMIRETVIVSPDTGIQAASKGLNSEAFGHIKVKMFATLDDAIAYARSQR